MRRGTLFGLVAILVGVLLLASCNMLFPSQEGEDDELQSSEQPVATGTAAPGEGTPAAGTTAEAVEPSDSPGATTTAPTSANIEVTPAEVAVGNVTLTLLVQPARHMFDQSATRSDDPTRPAPDQKETEQRKGSAVFPGGMLRVVNNIDPSQSPPADSAEAIFRHLVVQVRAKDSGQLLPYLDPTVDILLDGRPVIFDQALAPMVSVEGNSRELYYGNNIKFPRKGTYQVFVRMQPNPLLGQDQPPAAQFNLTMR